MFEIVKDEALEEQMRKLLEAPYDNTEDERIEAELQAEKQKGEPWTDIEW